ncbi:hypothetical protein RB595_003425 [Gaeumannomyces hyphopodioides]
MWQSRLVSAGAGGGGPPRDTIDWHRFLVSATLILFRIWLFPMVYLLERRRRSRRPPGRRSPRRGIIRRTIRCTLRRIINLILRGLWGPRPTTGGSSNGPDGSSTTPSSAAAATTAGAASDGVPVPEDPWVTAHNTNALNSPLYRIPEEVLLQVTESLDAPALYCFRQSCRRGIRLVAPEVVTANAPAPWEVETGCGRAGGGGGGIRGGLGGGGGVSSVLLGGRAAWGCAAEPPWQQNFVTARDLIGQALRRDLLCASCRDVRSGWERPLAVVNAVRRGVRCDGCSRADRRERHHPALLFSARMRAGRPPAGGRLCRGREGRIRLCAHVTIGWDQVESAAKSAAKEQRRGDRRVTLRCMHKSHDFGGRVAEDELESKDNKDGDDEWDGKKDWESKAEYQRRRLRMLREDTSRVWGHYPEVVVEPPPIGGAFGWKPDPTAREEKDAVASVLVRRMSAPFYFKTRPASLEELLRMLRKSGMHETIATCPHVTFDDVVRRSFDPNVCACVGRGKVRVHHQHEEPDAGCCMCHYIQTRGKESIFCDTMDPYLPCGPDLSDDEASATRPWYHQRPSRARYRPTRHGTSCNECLTEYWWMSNPSLSRIMRLVSTTPSWGVDGPLDPRWLRLVDANCRGDGDKDHSGEEQDAEAQDPLTRNLLWCPSDSGSGRQCAVARRGQAWGHGLERARHGIFELGHVYLNTGAIGTFLATLVYGGDRWESAAARNRRGRGGVGFLSQEMILGAM